MHSMKPISWRNWFSAVAHNLRSDEGMEAGPSNALDGTEALGIDEQSHT